MTGSHVAGKLYRYEGRSYYLLPTGTPEVPCKRRPCRATIAWVRTSNGRRMPLSIATARRTPDGDIIAEPHWGDCAGLGRAPASTDNPTTR